MTDAGIDQIYTMVEAALGAGQAEVDVHISPFRMTDEAMLAEAGSQWAGARRTLKEGFDLFVASGVPPAAAARRGRYVFGAATQAPDCAPVTGWRA